MKNFLKHIKIQNFKSLKNAELSDCKQINLLIGRPNAGKSNLLEAAGLLGLSHIRYDSAKKLTGFIIRLENEIRELPEMANNSKNENRRKPCN